MASDQVLDPEIPYVGDVPGGLSPGKMVKIRGRPTENAVRFAINYQLGPNLNPRDDIAIHLSPRFPEGIITRNHINSMSWGPEENHGPMVLQPGQDFEIILLCEPLQYKIAINGRHYTEFSHRLPYQKVTHLTIDGDVEIKSVSYESLGAPRSPRAGAPPPAVPVVDYGPPVPGGLYPTLNPQAPSMPQGAGGYGPPPDAYGGSGGYNPPRHYSQQPGYEKAEEEDVFGGCLDKVGLAVGGLIAAGGVAAAMHAINKKKKEQEDEPEHEKTEAKAENESGFGGLGALGAALASSLASNALQGGGGHGGYQPGYPGQDAGGGGGMLGSLLGAFGGGGGSQPAYAPQQPQSDPLGGLGSILGGVLGGGHQQPPAYQPSGGYSAPQSQQGGNDLLGSLGGAIGSSLLSSALEGLSKNRSHGDRPPSPPPQYHDYGPPRNDPPYIPPSRNDPPPPPPPRAAPPPASDGGKLTAAEISKGLGLSDDED